MSRSITIRDVPDEVVDELAVRAGRSGRSLQEYLRAHLTAFTARPDPQTWVDAVTARTSTVLVEVEPEEILQHRDAERR